VIPTVFNWLSGITQSASPLRREARAAVLAHHIQFWRRRNDRPNADPSRALKVNSAAWAKAECRFLRSERQLDLPGGGLAPRTIDAFEPIRCCERHAAHNFNAKDSAVVAVAIT